MLFESINYKFHSYVDSGAVRGNEAATAIGQDADKLFKTLVMKGTEKLAQQKTVFELYLIPVPVN
ncbi:prolyl-tRNA editing enzyme YbaK/EbsC (Cys-tRNA(Pro) deacylase) [Aequitasia blattaphilus]|uniref:Uncharacterized protein n=1 Tax=Aequitasia blattaphilus TaxID=2949332 RepID=A0ABT1E7M3_9FIRM|nr:hypothetical protein [Aequitasia blattaphilus]MCP1100982.1 hypothetical protein [Aequitasia blattaphilus]MCR8613622.1 hypothetical protein [Aequitasia blattaphilus]